MRTEGFRTELACWPLSLLPASVSAPTSRIPYRSVQDWFLGQIETRGLGWRLHVFSGEGLHGQKITIRRRRCLSWTNGGGSSTAARRNRDQRVSWEQNTRHTHTESGGIETAEKYSLGQTAHLGEAELEVPHASVGGHPLGGLTVLGELQGGSRLMTRRPQAAMLRFIWEALRKSWPRLGRWGSVPPSQCQPSPLPTLHTSMLGENTSLPLQPRPPFNDRVTEGYLKGHEQS